MFIWRYFVVGWFGYLPMDVLGWEMWVPKVVKWDFFINILMIRTHGYP